MVKITSLKDQQLLEKLKGQPHLKERIEKLLQIAESECAGCQTADQAEYMLVEQMQSFGNELLTSWSESTSRKFDEQLKRQDPKLKLREKKRPSMA